MGARRLEWIALGWIVPGWIVLGVALIAIHCLLVPLSRGFDYDAPLLTYPVVSFVGLEVLAGAIYLILLWLIPRSRAEPRLLALILGAGLVMRAVTMVSTPILEDDFYRYLWDGAVVAAGEDPYRYPPAEVLGAGPDAAPGLVALSELAGSSAPVAERVNHPHLTTIYPPFAQAVFAIGAGVESFDLTTWRWVLFLFEGATLVVLFLILLFLRRSPLWLAIYWWNPLVIKELTNSAHMDALLLPFLAAMVLLVLLGKRGLASLCLAVAAGVKLWPVLLLPTLLRPLLAEPRRLMAVLALFLAACSVTAWWVYQQASGQAGSESGLMAFSTGWNMNDPLFLVARWGVESGLDLFGAEWVNSGGATRVLLAAIVVWFCIWLNRHPAAGADELCTRFLVVIAMVFLLSPAQFPWYYTWLVPFLVVVPSPALLLLTALLPLYYLRFWLDIRDQSRLFDYGVVWLEFLPVWLLLAREWWLRARRSPAPS